jgi:Uma2 family endonuclease
MPPLLVEVLSPGNRKAEMAHKIQVYLESGAQEVVVIQLNGGIRFHRHDGVHEESSFGLQLVLPGRAPEGRCGSRPQ